MKKLLLVIDFQNEFINHNTVKAKIDIPKLVKSEKFDEVLFTSFVNNKNSPAYKKLGWHGCMDEESKKICMDVNGYSVIERHTYSAFRDDVCEYIRGNDIGDIYLCGIDADCCVLATAFDFFDNDYNTYVLEDYVYCMRGEKYKNNALDILRQNIGSKNVL